MLAGAISVKFVGLFVVLYVGIFTIGQLWDILGDLDRPLSYTLTHFAARAVCLILIPVVLYIAIFYVHLRWVKPSCGKRACKCCMCDGLCNGGY